MSADIILVFAVAALVLALFANVASRVGARRGEDTFDGSESGGRGEVLWKINQAIQMFRDNIDPAKLARDQAQHIAFYVSYLHAMAITFATVDEVEYDDILATPVTLEILRLTPEGTTATAYLASVLDSPAGRAGSEAGRTDALEATAADNDGPYFLSLRDYFAAVETSDSDSDT